MKTSAKVKAVVSPIPDLARFNTAQLLALANAVADETDRRIGVLRGTRGAGKTRRQARRGKAVA